jgi:pSer/pThr/pTyr-binding forkhead associated (FHA) protein
VTLGTAEGNDLVLTDPMVSRYHLELRRSGGRILVTDLGSTNGTQVNEDTVSERDLEEGDRITIGHTVLEFRRR